MEQPERTPIASVEAVRDELRRLGYLDSSLDRFVLGGAGGPSPFRASLRTAARVGLLGGVLFGLAGTLTAAALDARLLAEPQDLLVLTLYLLVAFGLVTALAALAGGFLADWAGRQLGRHPGPTLPRNVGFLIGLAGLVYLGFWWRSHLAGALGAAILDCFLARRWVARTESRALRITGQGTAAIAKLVPGRALRG